MKIISLLMLLGLMVVSVTIVFAHGNIERSEPADGTTLNSSPEIIRIWFNDSLAADSGMVSIIDSQGQSIELVSLQQDPSDRTLLVATLPPDLADGAYVVTASGLVSDGDNATGSFVFWVRSQAQISPAYEIVGLMFGVMMLAGGVGFWLSRRDSAPMELVPPEQELPHVSFE